MKKLRELERVLQSILKSDKWDIKRYNNTHTVDIFFDNIYLTATQIAEQSKTKYIMLKTRIRKELGAIAIFYPESSEIKIICKLKKK